MARDMMKRPTMKVISEEKELNMISELMDGRLSKPTTKQALDKILTSVLSMNTH